VAVLEWARIPWKHGSDSEPSQYSSVTSNTQLRNAYR